jgi:uncharacterized protein YjbI with pentapeptide repeats
VTYTPEHVQQLLASHAQWLRKETGGIKASFQSADFHGIDLNGANLKDVSFEFADLASAQFRGANLIGANFAQANLEGADLAGADLRSARFFDANLKGANLQGADAGYASFGGADLSDADLQNANLQGARFDYARMIGANLGGAKVFLRAFENTFRTEKDFHPYQKVSTYLYLVGFILLLILAFWDKIFGG